MFFLCWLCVHIRSLDWPRRYTTTLAWLKALFSKPLYPPGPTLPSRGECDQERSRWTFRDGHLVSFYFLFLFFVLFLCFYFSHMLSLLPLRRVAYSLCCFSFSFFSVPLSLVPQPHSCSFACLWKLSRLTWRPVLEESFNGTKGSYYWCLMH